MKKTPKILPHLYKSKGTPIFRDTTALPFVEGGPIEPLRSTPKYPTPTSTASPKIVYVSDYNKFQELNKQYLDSLSTVRGGVYKSIDLNKPKVYTSIPEGKKTPYYPNKPYQFYSPRNSNSILGSVVADYNPHKNLGINPTHIVSRVNSSGQEEFYMKFQPPQIKPVYKKPIPPKPPIDKTVVKEEIPPVPPPPPVPVKDPEPLEKLEILRPELISRNIPKELSLPPQPEVLQYQMPGYMKSYNFPTVGRYTPLAAKAVQKATGYDRNFMEGYYDEEGNYVPGELENAREQNRVPQFQGASSLRDMFAQKAYQQALEETNSFANGGTIHFERSEYGSDAREHYNDGGPIYTYSKRPGSYYQRANDGSWMINNSSTGGQYVPIDDPTGQRTALLNKNAVVYNAPAQGAPKPVMNQAVWDKAQQQGKNDIAAQQMINETRKVSGTQGLYMPDGSLRPQAAQAADWVPQALVAAPMALDVLGTAAAAEIPFTGGVNLGGAANAAGIAYGATQVDDRYRDWQNVASGKMDWKEAALKTGLTSLDFAGAGIPIKNASNIVKGINAPTKLKGQTLIGSPTKKVMGTIDEFGDYTNASGVTVHGSSSPIGLGKTINPKKTSFNSEAPAISLEDWKEANKIANSTNQRFIIPKGEEEFLVNKYTEEFANKFGIPIEKVNPKDVGLYAKLKEAEFIPTRETISPAEGAILPNLSKQIHTDFIQKHKPDFNLKKQEELVLDAYARGYDRSINLREPDLAATFYQDEVAPILEQTILQNKFKEPQTLIRGTRNFDIENGASVIRNGETIEGIKFSDLQPGDLFVPKTFTSTSIVKNAPKTKLGFEEPLTGFTQRAENLDYVINAPAGQSYLYANASPIQQFPREMEAILPKDLQFKLDRVASDVERGYLTSMNDVQKGQLYNGFTKMPNKYFPSISSLDKVVDLKGRRIPKKQYPALIKRHNMLFQPSVPKYYFSIANPYLFGGRLNKNC